MEIVKYQDKYKNDIVKLNLTWIERFYKVEQSDLDVLEHIELHIEKWAMMFLAVVGEKVLATCMIETYVDDI